VLENYSKFPILKTLERLGRKEVSILLRRLVATNKSGINQMML